MIYAVRGTSASGKKRKKIEATPRRAARNFKLASGRCAFSFMPRRVTRDPRALDAPRMNTACEQQSEILFPAGVQRIPNTNDAFVERASIERASPAATWKLTSKSNSNSVTLSVVSRSGWLYQRGGESCCLELLPRDSSRQVSCSVCFNLSLLRRQTPNSGTTLSVHSSRERERSLLVD